MKMDERIILHVCPKHHVNMRFEFCEECNGGATFGRYCATCQGDGGFWVCSRCDSEQRQEHNDN